MRNATSPASCVSNRADTHFMASMYSAVGAQTRRLGRFRTLDRGRRRHQESLRRVVQPIIRDAVCAGHCPGRIPDLARRRKHGVDVLRALACLKYKTHHRAAGESDLTHDRACGELLIERNEELPNAIAAQHVHARSRKLARTNTLRDRNGTGLSTSADALRLSKPETNQGWSSGPTPLVHSGASAPHSAASVSAAPPSTREAARTPPPPVASNSAADRERRAASTQSIRWWRQDPSPSSSMRRDAQNSEPGGSRRTRATARRTPLRGNPNA